MVGGAVTPPAADARVMAQIPNQTADGRLVSGFGLPG